MSEVFEQGNAYVIDAESPAELARLLHQDRLYSKVLGLLPDTFKRNRLHSILDLACGPGGWALDLATALPRAQVTGIDISARMIQYANAQADVQQIPNAHFLTMNALETQAFESNSFDLVHARLLTGFMGNDTWPLLLRECMRITRPDGFLCLTECEWGISNGPVFQKLSGYLLKALHLAGRTYSSDGSALAITPMMRRLMREAGYTHIQELAQHLDFSSGTEFHEPFYQNMMSVFKLVQPFIVAMKVADADELNTLYQQLPAEMLSSNFNAIWFFLTVWGEKAA